MKFITVSRQMGSNGGIIAREVADKLGYKFHDTGSIDNLALKMGFLDLTVLPVPMSGLPLFSNATFPTNLQ